MRSRIGPRRSRAPAPCSCAERGLDRDARGRNGLGQLRRVAPAGLGHVVAPAALAAHDLRLSSYDIARLQSTVYSRWGEVGDQVGTIAGREPEHDGAVPEQLLHHVRHLPGRLLVLLLDDLRDDPYPILLDGPRSEVLG